MLQTRSQRTHTQSDTIMDTLDVSTCHNARCTSAAATAPQSSRCVRPMCGLRDAKMHAIGMTNPGSVGMRLLRDRCCRRALRSLLAALRNSAFEIVSGSCIVTTDNVKNGSRHSESHLLRWMRLLPQVHGHQESTRRRVSREGACTRLLP